MEGGVILKNFDDFLATLTEDKLSEIAERGNEPLTVNYSDGKSIGTAIGIISLKLSLNLLREYHEWLVKIDQSQSPD